MIQIYFLAVWRLKSEIKVLSVLALRDLGKDLLQVSLLASGTSLAYDSIIPIFTWYAPCV